MQGARRIFLISDHLSNNVPGRLGPGVVELTEKALSAVSREPCLRQWPWGPHRVLYAIREPFARRLPQQTSDLNTPTSMLNTQSASKGKPHLPTKAGLNAQGPRGTCSLQAVFLSGPDRMKHQ